MENFWNDEHRGWKINDIEVSPKTFLIALPLVFLADYIGMSAIRKVTEKGIRIISRFANSR